MTMRFTQLATHWDAEEALAVIEFLDSLRNALWCSHGAQIERMLRDSTSTPHHRNGEEQMGFEFDDQIPF